MRSGLRAVLVRVPALSAEAKGQRPAELPARAVCGAGAIPQHVRASSHIEGMKPEIEKSLQSDAGAATLARHYYNAIRFNPLLMQCTPESLVASLLLSAQVRLEPGPLGHVYLVPFKAAVDGGAVRSLDVQDGEAVAVVDGGGDK